jgi:hypothetical protein
MINILTRPLEEKDPSCKFIEKMAPLQNGNILALLIKHTRNPDIALIRNRARRTPPDLFIQNFGSEILVQAGYAEK